MNNNPTSIEWSWASFSSSFNYTMLMVNYLGLFIRISEIEFYKSFVTKKEMGMLGNYSRPFISAGHPFQDSPPPPPPWIIKSSGCSGQHPVTNLGTVPEPLEVMHSLPLI